MFFAFLFSFYSFVFKKKMDLMDLDNSSNLELYQAFSKVRTTAKVLVCFCQNLQVNLPLGECDHYLFDWTI